MKTIQDPETYLQNQDNIFHQLRGHYLLRNIREHPTFIHEEILESVRPMSDRGSMQVNILQAKLRKLKYMRLRRKGDAPEEEEGSTQNLQARGSNTYYPLEQLWEKLGQNDLAEHVEEKQKTWRQLTPEEQVEHLKIFTDRFKNDMVPEVWRDMRKNLLDEHTNGKFEDGKIIDWNRKSQKIVMIKGLVINGECFWWEED